MVNEHRSAPRDAIVRTDALGVLQDVLEWRMTEPRWVPVRSALDALRAAYDIGDAAALRTAVQDLELAGPVRANSLNGPEIGVPEQVYDIVNGMVHDLSGGEPAPLPDEEPA